jgi:hypothetical protein
VDPFFCDALTDVGAVARDIRNLARVLSKINPLAFGLLSCYGVIKYYTDTDGALSRFEFVFSIPPSLRNPSSLRSILVEGRDNHALTVQDLYTRTSVLKPFLSSPATRISFSGRI